LAPLGWAEAPSPAGEEETALIPRQLLFGNPERAMVRLSPDGSRLSYLAPLDGVMNVWVAPIDDLNATEAVTSDSGRGIPAYFWAYTNEHVLYIQDEDGDENWRVYSVNLTTLETQDLTPLEGVQAQIQAVSPDLPGEIVIGLNDRVPQLHDLYRLDITTGERELLYENEGFVAFIFDDLYTLHFGMAPTPDGGFVVMRRVENSWEEEPFAVIGMEDALTTAPVGLGKNEQSLYMIDSRGRDTAALTVVALLSGEERVLFEDPRADVSDAIIHPTEKTIEAAASTHERTTWTVLDPAIAADLDYLRGVADGDIEEDHLAVLLFQLVHSFNGIAGDKLPAYSLSHGAKQQGARLVCGADAHALGHGELFALGA
jgi:hypothetical protein